MSVVPEPDTWYPEHFLPVRSTTAQHPMDRDAPAMLRSSQARRWVVDAVLCIQRSANRENWTVMSEGMFVPSRSAVQQGRGVRGQGKGDSVMERWPLRTSFVTNC